VIAESFLQRCKRWLSGAVTGGNVFDFEPLMQGDDNLLDVRVRCHNQVKATSDEVNTRIDGRRGFDDLPGSRKGTRASGGRSLLARMVKISTVAVSTP
jgi:hypothetical protein